MSPRVTEARLLIYLSSRLFVSRDRRHHSLKGRWGRGSKSARRSCRFAAKSEIHSQLEVKPARAWPTVKFSQLVGARFAPLPTAARPPRGASQADDGSG